jgi:hypothetical protein
MYVHVFMSCIHNCIYTLKFKCLDINHKADLRGSLVSENFVVELCTFALHAAAQVRLVFFPVVLSKIESLWSNMSVKSKET